MHRKRCHRGAPFRTLTPVAVIAVTAALTGPIAHADTTANSAATSRLDRAAVAADDARHAHDHAPNTTEEAIAKARATHKNMPIDSLTTEYSETAATPDGHLQLTQHPDQQRMKRGGGWVSLDATLAANPDSTFSPKAAPAGLVLSKGGDGPLATMTSSDGKKLAITASFTLPAPIASGDSLLYPSVAPDTDLRVTATKSGGVKTVLIVKTQAAANSPALSNLHFTTTADGVIVAADKGGNLTAKAADGKPRWTASTPTMWDSSETALAAPRAAALSAETALPAASAADTRLHSDASGPGSTAKVSRMPVTANDTSIDLAPDQDLLKHGKAPYYIDPSWLPWSNSASGWTWVQSATPDTSNWQRSGSNDTDYPAVGLCGYYAAGGSCSPTSKNRAFFQIDTSALSGASLSSATLTFEEYVTANWDCTTTYPVDLYLTSGIDNSTTWNNQPAQNGGSLGTKQVGGSGHGSCYGNVPFDYDITSTMQQYGTSSSSLTFGLYGDESNQNAFKRVKPQPTLTVQYDRAPSTPTNPGANPAPRTVSPSGTDQVCYDAPTSKWNWLGAGSNQAGAVSLNATLSSPTQSQLYTWTNIWDDSVANAPSVASGLSALTGNGNTASFPLPANALTDGHAYGFHMMATDQLAGVPNSAMTPVCHFRVDLTPPTVSFPTTVSDPTTQFPPAGNGQVTKLYVGQQGYVPYTPTDPSPGAGLDASGVACTRWGWDPQLADGNWQCGSSMPVSQIPVTPAHWGTNILYIQAEDNAGNTSPIAPYAFYVPWNANGPAPVFGDVTGDGVPDILAPDTAGNLRAFSVPGNTTTTPAGAPAETAPTTPLAAARANSPAGDSWANYRITHRGSLRGGMNADDLIVHKDSDPNLYAYYNPGNSGIPGLFDAHSVLAKPACVVNSLNKTCTGYAADWSGTLQIAAAGDPTTSNLNPNRKFLNRTGLFTIETNSTGDGALWYYPVIGDSTLGAPVNLITTGWKKWELLSPGDWFGQGHPGLMARNLGNGDLRGYTFTVGTGSYDDGFGGKINYPVITDMVTNTKIGSGITAASWPRIGSDGDLTGSGHSTLWGITPSGGIQIWTGSPTGTSTSPGYNWVGPSTVGTTNSSPLSWRLNGASSNNGKANDASGSYPATIYGTPGWTTDRKGTANGAVSFNSSSLLRTTGPAVDTSQSYTVSAWVNVTSPDADQVFLAEGGNQHQAFYLSYTANPKSWHFLQTASDAPSTNWIDATVPTTTTGWTHLVGTYDVSSHVLTLYVNGKYAASANNLSPWQAPYGLSIGACANPDNTPYSGGTGSVSEVHTYPYPLTAAQVNALYTS
ncbi:hypothetical protein KV557_37695 [Kitasatospora aureofaciens]|uniref:LamG-like jellyroll fold domain-containing protein n=1 Tax=Kitasatospora aureofaciens TaxID=1894 RepID=UPI001C482E29|nr:LamG-like jellyroll fold domain-containing protein [Kitasatospora aureofaciens]MBV6702770.1 hypothetical protein [Kitasatospora aureofaciens]